MRRLLVAASLVALVLLLLWWLRPSETTSTAARPYSTPPVTDVQHLAGAPRDKVGESSEEGSGSALDPVETEEQSSMEGMYCPNRYMKLACFDLGQGIEPLLRSSLANMDQQEFLAAVEVSFLIQFCKRAPRSEAELLEVVLDGYPLHRSIYQAFEESELAESKYAQDKPEYPLYNERVQYDFRSTYCQPIQALVDGGFRAHVAQRAEMGNEAYQLLFTLWRPDHNAPFDERLAWQLQSMDYSEKSISSGSAMGLLAYTWSYLGGGFTPYQVIISVAYGKAALLCSVDPRLLPEVVHMIEPENVEQFVHGLFSGDAIGRWPEELARNCL